MKKIIFAIAMLACSLVSNAAEYKLAKTSFDVVAGGTVVIPIQLDLTAAEVGTLAVLQIDAVLSDATKFNRESVSMATDRMAAGMSTQYLCQIAGKAIGIIGQKNAAVIMGESGDVMYLTISADAAAAAGDVCTVTFSNFKIGDVAGNMSAVSQSGFTATINVVDYVTIDENVDFTPFEITKDVHLIRSFEAGKYYTICLPFAVNATALTTAFGTKPTLYKFNGVSLDSDGLNTITLDFASSALIAANTPYIMLSNVTIDNPIFAGAKVKAVTNNITTTVTEEEYVGADVYFKGTYTPGTVVPAGALYLKSSDAKLYVSQGGTKMKGTRAYIDITELGATFDVKNCVLALDGQETAIDAIDADLKAEGWFDLNGRKLAEKPATKGVYINNGKKVVVK
jgi:hypothetical protein